MAILRDADHSPAPSPPIPTHCLSPDVYVHALGRVWCEPTTFATDLLLALLLAVLAARARPDGNGGGRAYFALLSVAFLVGGLRHLLHHELLALVPALSRVQNVASSLSLGLLGPVLALGRDGRERRVVAVAWGLLAAGFVVAHLVSGAFWLTIAHQSIAQLAAVAVVVATGRAQDYRWFLGSIGLGLVCAVLFATKAAPHPWFNHNDLAHLIMLPAFWLMGAQLARVRTGGSA
ncbi:MAG: hypothetical protein H6742_12010 [Alphaproteobacteria bacterium]|nr:hypothetical protein [Alphaproteobacteria bacterium]